ncbi:Na+/H+ antiporter subunit G [Tropicimonas isoalkanivorans]|uniref:Multisubunit potassium/proton antiporter, PhaG subunit (TC 2.A.63.1.1) n=1 Tax=Tropicimonas isoalkanivorans TaxID=441112 RepID=A0A1I1GI58_9RHOB|nr:Na+/H+ antiporter subunit G [Tropicimonas isoalkanivorans]SFC11191.1 multisubunit potassium/proton antiporter, PhaG subunit (TC 2.A.63.1.1) [Tropicimonas isoalkanivorans]
MGLVAEIFISFMLVVGGIFGLLGSWGLVKLDDTMRRLHAPTKATTLGVGGVLFASMAYSVLELERVSFHELLIAAFLLITAPITANFVAKAHMHRDVKERELPPTGGKYGWAGYDEIGDSEQPIDTK